MSLPFQTEVAIISAATLESIPAAKRRDLIVEALAECHDDALLREIAKLMQEKMR